MHRQPQDTAASPAHEPHGAHPAVAVPPQRASGLYAELSPKEWQDVERLVEIGFDREAAYGAFIAAGRDPEVAASWLLAG
mmetsp:Transcript_112454/g.350476  ORF Transcript_112454/g.350476 Transcript_112454/m.350476 type:complete len:80 (-) Transcript_112454:114-353(-)